MWQYVPLILKLGDRARWMSRVRSQPCLQKKFQDTRATQCDLVSKKINKIGIAARQCAYAMLALRRWKEKTESLRLVWTIQTHFYIHIKYRDRPKKKTDPSLPMIS